MNCSSLWLAIYGSVSQQNVIFFLVKYLLHVLISFLPSSLANLKTFWISLLFAHHMTQKKFMTLLSVQRFDKIIQSCFPIDINWSKNRWTNYFINFNSTDHFTPKSGLSSEQFIFFYIYKTDSFPFFCKVFKLWYPKNHGTISTWLCFICHFRWAVIFKCWKNISPKNLEIHSKTRAFVFQFSFGKCETLR